MTNLLLSDPSKVMFGLPCASVNKEPSDKQGQLRYIFFNFCKCFYAF